MRVVTRFIHNRACEPTFRGCAFYVALICNKACHKLALAVSCQQALFNQTVRACAFCLSACCSLFNQAMRILSVNVNVLRRLPIRLLSVAGNLNCLTQHRMRAYPMQRALCDINPLSFITHGLWVATHSTNMRYHIMARLIVPFNNNHVELSKVGG